MSSLKTLRYLHHRLNEICIILINAEPCCTLCDIKLLSQSAYDKHMKGKPHRAKLHSILKELVAQILSPGIIMTGDDYNTLSVSIYCVLCEQQVGGAFDSDFHAHINSSGHQTKLIHQMNLQETHHGLVKFYKSKFGKTSEEDELLKGVSRAGIIVSNDGRYRCVPCNRELTTKSQFSAHMKEVKHKEWVFSQLSKVFDKVGLSLGVIVEGGSFVCKLCKCQFGNGLATDEAYKHTDVISLDDEHNKRVLEQMEGGLHQYFESENDDLATLDMINWLGSSWALMNHVGGDLEEYALQALHWNDLDSDEEMLMYMGLSGGDIDMMSDDTDDDDEDDYW